LLDVMANQGGLLGLSGISGDVRDLEQAAADGNDRARLAMEMFVAETRRYLGGHLVELGGADVIAFTGGIGERGANVRREVCQGLEELGIVLDPELNSACQGQETRLSASDSRAQVWVVPTNEELIVARQTKQLLEG
ncbi:MAG: acetate/propionate family kinase, partial [Planctomycetales bacterium]